MPLRFNDEHELMEIFSTLEEQNLFLIQRCQESEQQLEEKKLLERKVKEEQMREYAILQENEKVNMQKIQRSNQEKNALLGITEDSEEKSLDPGVLKQLEAVIADLYKTTKVKGDGKVDASVETKIQNSSLLQLIEETEYALNRYNEEFEYIQNKGPQFKQHFDREARTLKKKKIGIYRDTNKKMEEAKLREFQLQRQKEKENKNFKKIGKPNMTTVWRKPVDKKKEKVHTITDEQQDMLDYLGM